MKKWLSLVLALCMLACLPFAALAETAEVKEVKDIELSFLGEKIACRPISLTKDAQGAFVLILYIEGQSDFVLSQKYSVMSPIYACILGEDGSPLSPNQVKWTKDIVDCCYYYYEVEEMPETLALIPMDAVQDPTAWYTLTLSDVPTETPEGYAYPEEEKKE